MTTYYMDYVNGADANNGSDWAHAKKTIDGFTADILSPGDIVRIAKSPAPVSTGVNATWTNLSKTVSLASALTLNIDMCESAWTAANSASVTRIAVTTDAKEGSYCMRVTAPSSPTTNKLYAYYATGTLDLSSKQKISFWIKNEVALSAGNWKICLCSDTAGANIVDTFEIPAIPSTARWVPLTIARTGGGNLGNAIRSIALYSSSAAPTASKYVYIDDFIACTTDGLNLQSLISKNSAEQGGTEGWYGIQSINGTTILLDNDTNTKANAGKGYSGTTETVALYKRETIKTNIAANQADAVQTVQDSGTVGSNIEFQGGYNTSTTSQDGETFFDGLNGTGYGIYLNGKSFTTFNYINVFRYYNGIHYYNSSNNLIMTMSNANNNRNCGIYYYYNSNNNSVTTLHNANNNNYGIDYDTCNNNSIAKLSNANNNTTYGIYYIYSNNNFVAELSNANNNLYGVNYNRSSNNIIIDLVTSNNSTASIYNYSGINYIFNASLSEITEITGFANFANAKIFSQKHDQTANNHKIFTDGGLISSESTIRHTASGISWKLSPTSTNRNTSYPLDLTVAKVLCNKDTEVTIKAWMRRDNTGITGKLVCKGKQIAGVDSDVSASITADADEWEEVSISFTPTAIGVVEIEVWAYNGTSYNVYVDDLNISQA